MDFYEKLLEDGEMDYFFGELKRDGNGRPIIELRSLENTAVDTSNLGDFRILMRVYECGGWKWRNGDLPTEFNFRKDYTKWPCVGAFNHYFRSTRHNFEINKGFSILSSQEFYDIQKVTPEHIEEINRYFRENR